MLVKQDEDKLVYSMQDFGWGDLETAKSDLCSDSMQCDNFFGVHPFYIEKGNYVMQDSGFFGGVYFYLGTETGYVFFPLRPLPSPLFFGLEFYSSILFYVLHLQS